MPVVANSDLGALDVFIFIFIYVFILDKREKKHVSDIEEKSSKDKMVAMIYS